MRCIDEFRDAALDVMQAVLMLVGQLNDGGAVAENQFTPAVTRDGNRKAQTPSAPAWYRRRGPAPHIVPKAGSATRPLDPNVIAPYTEG